MTVYFFHYCLNLSCASVETRVNYFIFHHDVKINHMSLHTNQMSAILTLRPPSISQ